MDSDAEQRQAPTLDDDDDPSNSESSHLHQKPEKAGSWFEGIPVVYIVGALIVLLGLKNSYRKLPLFGSSNQPFAISTTL